MSAKQFVGDFFGEGFRRAIDWQPILSAFVLALGGPTIGRARSNGVAVAQPPRLTSA